MDKIKHCENCKHDEVLCKINGFNCDCHIVSSETYEFPKCKIQSCKRGDCQEHCPCDCHYCTYKVEAEKAENPLHLSSNALHECEVKKTEAIRIAEINQNKADVETFKNYIDSKMYKLSHKSCIEGTAEMCESCLLKTGGNETLEDLKRFLDKAIDFHVG